MDDEPAGEIGDNAERDATMAPSGPEPRQVRTDGEFLMGNDHEQDTALQNEFTPRRFWDPNPDTSKARKRPQYNEQLEGGSNQPGKVTEIWKET